MKLTKYQDGTWILWEKLPEHLARIFRIYGNYPQIKLPDKIEDCTVTALADYCFSDSPHLPRDVADPISAGEEASAVRELCGSYLDSVTFPDTLTEIGNYCFYNCKKLRKLYIGRCLQNIGSDAFMNCHLLQMLFVKGSVLEQSGLRQILSQISWDLEVFFIPENPKKVQAAVFFPEFYDTYNEIAPAHIFGRSITGEGFRARQSFRDGVVDFSLYDTIFQKACAEESELTVCRLVYDRLRYPYGLAFSVQENYEAYLRQHGRAFCQCLVKQKQLEPLSFLYEKRLLTTEDANYTLRLAAEADWPEGSASLQQWKQRYYQIKTKERYSFDTG